MPRFFRLKLLLNISVLLVTLAGSVFALEFVLRALHKDYFYVWPPKLEKMFRPQPEIMPGVNGASRFTINSMGIRGEKFSRSDDYRILTIGGSTTECLYLDDEETWPHLLQVKLNENTRSFRTWVGNVGRSGQNSWQYLLVFKELLRQYPKIDAVILLAGINDLSIRLSRDQFYKPLDPDSREFQVLWYRTFSVLPELTGKRPVYTFSETRRRLDILKKRIRGEYEPPDLVQDETGSVYLTWRSHRQNASSFRSELPDLNPALNEYYRNLNMIIDMAESYGVRVVFVTQPSIWRADLPQKMKDLLWYGGIGRFQTGGAQTYYTVEALAAAMDVYNEVLKRACADRNVECIDLAAHLPRDTTVFYDDVHFNESGANKVASYLCDYFLATATYRDHVKNN